MAHRYLHPLAPGVADTMPNRIVALADAIVADPTNNWTHDNLTLKELEEYVYRNYTIKDPALDKKDSGGHREYAIRLVEYYSIQILATLGQPWGFHTTLVRQLAAGANRRALLTAGEVAALLPSCHERELRAVPVPAAPVPAAPVPAAPVPAAPVPAAAGGEIEVEDDDKTEDETDEQDA